jgi:hypothetical protein
MRRSDEVHYGEVYERNGTLTSTSMGRKRTGTWRVVEGELCTEMEKGEDTNCYEVCMRGDNVQLRIPGSCRASEEQQAIRDMTDSELMHDDEVQSVTQPRHTRKSVPLRFSGARRADCKTVRSELAYAFIAFGASAVIGLFGIGWYSFWDAAHGRDLPGRNSPLLLEGKSPLGSVAGRIDHMAIDVARHRLFVAELGNNTVGVLDVDGKTLVHRIMGLSEPQGIAYVPPSDTVFVANGGDGSLRVFRASDYAAVARIELGGDADNVRFDKKSGRVLVGFGSGGIAVIDLQRMRK